MRLDVKNLSFHYTHGRDILRGVTFSCKNPEIVCILGENGIGKSTLLKCITGEERGTGSILLDNRPIADYSARELSQKIAYIPQNHVPVFPYRVLDVVMMGRTPHTGLFSSPTRADENLAMENLKFLRIESLSDQPYTEISGGERQLVLIAAALTQQPELLILDEPTAHLDFGNQFRFLQLVQRLNQLGVCVLMTTHFPDHALYLNGKTLILQNGTIKTVGNAKDIITEQSMEELYRLEVHICKEGQREICIPGSLSGFESQKETLD